MKNVLINSLTKESYGEPQKLIPQYDPSEKISECKAQTRWYCIKAILSEEFLWDMRCWDKPRNEYSHEEVIIQIQSWLSEYENGFWTCNCTGCLSCIQTLLDMNLASIEEIATLVMKNTKVTNAHDIGSWVNFMDRIESTLECGHCGRFIDECESDAIVSEDMIRCGSCNTM